MSRKEAVTLVCRALSVYFLFWFLADLTYLPGSLFSYLHHRLLTTSNYELYLRNYYFLSLCFLVLRIIALFFAVQWFYRAGPRLQGYFTAPPIDEAEELQTL